MGVDMSHCCTLGLDDVDDKEDEDKELPKIPPLLVRNVNEPETRMVMNSFRRLCERKRSALTESFVRFKANVFCCKKSIKALKVLRNLKNGNRSLLFDAMAITMKKELFAMYMHKLVSPVFDHEERWVFWGVNASGSVIQIDVTCNRKDNKLGAMNSEIKYSKENVRIEHTNPPKNQDLDLAFVDWCSDLQSFGTVSCMRTLLGSVIVILNNDFT